MLPNPWNLLQEISLPGQRSRRLTKAEAFEGGYVLLDLRHLQKERIEERLPGIRLISLDFAGVDPVEAPISCSTRPTLLHGRYICGKRPYNRTSRAVCSRGMFLPQRTWANRLGGNSLLETIVFGSLQDKKLERVSQRREVGIGIGLSRLLLNTCQKRTRG